MLLLLDRFAPAWLAGALGAAKLVVLTDVEGLFANWPDRESVISELSAVEPHLLELAWRDFYAAVPEKQIEGIRVTGSGSRTIAKVLGLSTMTGESSQRGAAAVQVSAPSSMPPVARHTRCEAIRLISMTSTRMVAARCGISMPSSFSTAMQ